MTLEGNGGPFWKGTVGSIHVAERAGDTMRPVDETRAVAGSGLEGDRYYEVSVSTPTIPAPSARLRS